MRERIVQLRTALKLSQAKFAEKINLSRNFIGLVECGDRNLSDRTITDICQTFNVNEEWLRTGDGEMFRKLTRNQQLSEFVNDVMEDVDSSYRKRFIVALSKLMPDDWKVIEKITDSLKEES